MKMLFAIDNLGSGGAQRQMVTLALGLAARQHFVEFFVYHPQYDHYRSELEEAGIPIHSCSKRGRYSLRPVVVLRSMLTSRNYDLVLSFLDTPNFYAELAVLGIDVPVVVSERNAYHGSKPTSGKWLVEQFHRVARAVVVNSHYQAERMLASHEWMRGRLYVIYNGLDLNAFRPPIERTELHETFLCVGSVTQRKNPLGVAQALYVYRKLYGSCPVVHWYGETYLNAESQLVRQQTDGFLKRSSLSDRWKWMGVSKNMHKVYLSHGALVHASYREGLPNAIVEAMSCGLPVIGSNVCEIPRIIEEGKTGFLVEPGVPSSIANAMHKLLTLSGGDRRQMGDDARKYAEKVFSVSSYIGHFEALMESLI